MPPPAGSQPFIMTAPPMNAPPQAATVPSAPPAVVPASLTTTTRTTATAPAKHVPRYYRLRAGETLSDVAVRFNTTVERLLALNPHVKPTSLTVDQRIRVR